MLLTPLDKYLTYYTQKSKKSGTKLPKSKVNDDCKRYIQGKRTMYKYGMYLYMSIVS